ncbi:unnamed protein product, partial [Schistocephalus solidus]|uniref:C2H2-type domain-containing protein n=2 Tax=Schistocephalus solidus TaxID=70667 RepID=A0A183SWZ4_SCHSO
VPSPRRTTSDRDSSPSAPSYFLSNQPDTTNPTPRVRSLLPLKRSYASANIEVPLAPTTSTSTDYLFNQQRVQTLGSSSTSAIPTLGSLSGGASSIRRAGPLHLIDPTRPDSNVEDDFARVRLDPSVELILSRIKRSLRASEAQITANQTELQRFKFTQDSEPVPGAPTHSRNRRLHYPRAFTHRMGLFGHIRIHDSGIHSNVDNTDTSCTPSAPAILTATATLTTINDIPPASTDFSCPHCARNFNSHIGLVGHLRIHRTEAGEPVPGAPTYSRRARLHCPHCSRTFTHHMGLLEHMRLHDNLRQNGKRIMNRIRVLESENEELARQRESGRPARLNCLIALRQDFIARVKKTNENLESLVEESEAETEVFTSTLVVLQQQLGLARTTIEVLGAALGAIEPVKCLELFSRANWPLPECLSHLVTETVATAPATDGVAEATKLRSPSPHSPFLPGVASPTLPAEDEAPDSDTPLPCQEPKMEGEVEEKEQQTTMTETTPAPLLTEMSSGQVDVSKISESPEASPLPPSPSPSPPPVSQPPVSVFSSDIASESAGPGTEMPPATISPSLVTVRPPINELPPPSPYCRDPRILRHRT